MRKNLDPFLKSLAADEEQYNADSRCVADRGPFALNPQQVQFQSWVSKMSLGCYSEAWKINDLSGCHWPSAHVLWDNASLDGRRVLVRSHHGLGDAVQMLRYAPILKTVCSRAVFQVSAAFLPLMDHFLGVADATSLEIASGDEKFELEIEIMELPYVFRTKQQELPLATNYLDTSGALKHRFRGRVAQDHSKLRVGLAWEGSEWDLERWIALDLLAPLFDVDCEFWCLQGPVAQMQHLQPMAQDGSETSGYGLDGFVGLIANLDLIITIDTFAAHIGGALGLPTWLLLKQEADWRWMRDVSKTPWYPSMRLFRQKMGGDWTNVVLEVHEALRSYNEPCGR